MAPPGRRSTLLWSRSLARVTDDLIRIPGTNFGIGLDALIGLVPGVGDAIGTGLSGFIMIDAVRQRVPYSVLLRMGWNAVFDTALGFVPVVGDVADMAHRANRKNYRLLERAVAEGRTVDKDVTGYVFGAAAIVIITLAIAISLVVVLVLALLQVLIPRT